jgi:hypothetical protein
LLWALDNVRMSGASTSKEPKLRLTIGAPVTVSSRSSGRISARVLGMCEGASIIAHIPNGAVPELLEGDDVEVRYLAGRTAYGFKTVVLRVCATPYPYFHLAYPLSIQDVEVRKSERVAIAIPAVASGSSGPQTEVQIRDLSCTGALLISSVSLGSPGDVFKLSFEPRLGEIKKSLQLSATVCNVQTAEPPVGDTASYRFGVRFEVLPEADRIFILAVVYENLASVYGLIADVAASESAEPASAVK